MQQSRTRTLIGAAMLGIVLVATACAGGDGKDATKDKRTHSAPSTTAGRNNASTAGGGEFCGVIKAQFAAFTKYTNAPLPDPDVRKQYGVTSKKLNDKLMKTAPAELGRDVAVQARAANGIADAFENGGTPSPVALAQLRTPEYRAAARRISAYAKDRCGIEVTSSAK